MGDLIFYKNLKRQLCDKKTGKESFRVLDCDPDAVVGKHVEKLDFVDFLLEDFLENVVNSGTADIVFCNQLGIFL